MKFNDDAPPECGQVIAGYCSEKKPKIDIKCHNVKKQAGDMILFEINDQTCYCICSCLGVGTLVRTNDEGGAIAVEKIVQDETKVLAAGLDLKFHPHTVKVVSHSTVGKIDHAVYLKYTSEGKTYESCVTMSHPYLLKDGSLIAAEVLSLSSELIDRHGNAVEIQELKWGTYEGAFWEFSTTDEIPNVQLTNHLVITNGVVTGDFAVEQWVKYKRPAVSGESPQPTPPIIGSKAWMQANRVHEVSAEEAPVRRVGGGYFIPATHSKVEIPSDASSFLPKNEADYLEENAPQRPYNDPLARQACVFALDRMFRPLYPEIEFHFDWFSYSANTYSWVDDDKKKNVLLCGGLSRIKGFDLQGICLALAHEVGHLLGKPDIGPSCVTCEGEADWWAGYSVLPQLWFAQEYFDNFKKAIAQVEVLYGYLDDPGSDKAVFDRTAPLDSRGRAYPDHECRINTWDTSMHSVDQPKCSQCKRP